VVLATLTLLAAFFIEGIGTYISILGLSALFAFNPVIIAIAIALDVGKLVTVTFVYKHWRDINLLMRLYMTCAAVVLVLITSMGAFGFLSAEFQKAIATNSQQNVLISSLTEEKERLLARKQQIDKQIAELPQTYARARVNVINAFREETARINQRLAQLDEELPKLKVSAIEKGVKIGPIIYVAEAFKVTPEVAVKWVILTIIFVFDPLAIALLLAGNFLIERRETLAKAAAAGAAGAEQREQPAPTVTEPAPEPVAAPMPSEPAQAPATTKPAPRPKPTKQPARRIRVEDGPSGNEIIKLEEPSSAEPASEQAPEAPAAASSPSSSSLERVDARRADVYHEQPSPSVGRFINVYRDSSPEPVVVGGPSSKVVKR
jgi:cell division protein FtsB